MTVGQRQVFFLKNGQSIGYMNEFDQWIEILSAESPMKVTLIEGVIVEILNIRQKSSKSVLKAIADENNNIVNSINNEKIEVVNSIIQTPKTQISQISAGETSLVEEVDLSSLRIIRDNFHEIYESSFNREFWVLNPITCQWEQGDEKSAHQSISELYLQKSLSSQVNYHYGKDLVFGRRYSKNSLQGISRQIRHTIAKDIYYDIDCVNSMPTNLLSLCKRLNFSNPILEKYCLNRDLYLEKWIGTNLKNGDRLTSKSEVKQYFLKILNGSRIQCDNSELKFFSRSMKKFHDTFYENTLFQEYRKIADEREPIKKEAFIASLSRQAEINGDNFIEDKTTRKYYDNRKAACLNYYLQEMENQVLIAIENALLRRNVRYGALVFDGIMVYKDDVKNIKMLLDQLMTDVSDQMGYCVKLSVKPMDEGIDLSKYSIQEDYKCPFTIEPKKSYVSIPRDISYSECKIQNVNGFENVSYLDLFREYDTIFVRSNMGSGKTQLIQSLFQEYKRIVFVSSKKSLAYNFHKYNPDFELYDDPKMTRAIDLDVTPRVIVQIDSLHRLVGQCDLFIPDEYIDLTSQLLSSCSRMKAISAFEIYTKYSSKRLIIDASLDRIDYFCSLIDFNKSIFIKDSKKIHTDKMITSIQTKEKLTDQILRSTGKIYVPSDSKTFIDSVSKKYQTLYPNKKIIVITHESHVNTKKESWDEYDAIFCSPAITAGVSFIGHIDHVYGYYCGLSINAWAASQQILRCRNWTSANICFPKMRNIQVPLSDIELERWIIGKMTSEINLIDGVSINPLKKEVIKNFSYHMFLENKKRTFRSKMFFKHYFSLIMNDHGIEMNEDMSPDISKETIKEIKKEMNEISLQNHIEHINDIASLISTSEDKENYSNKKYDLIQPAIVDKLHMTKTYGMFHDDSKWVSTYFKKQSDYRNLCSIVQNQNEQSILSGDDFSANIKTENMKQRRKICLSLLQKAGFTSLFDSNTIDLNEDLFSFVTQNKESISHIFGNSKKADLNNKKGIMTFVNSKLEDTLGIKLKSKNKQVNRIQRKVYFISGMEFWSENEDDFKPCLTRKTVQDRIIQDKTIVLEFPDELVIDVLITPSCIADDHPFIHL